MAILVNEIMNRESKMNNYMKHVTLRKQVNTKLFAKSYVINEMTIEKNDKTGQRIITSKSVIANDAPVIGAFGVETAIETNVTVEEKIDDNGNTRARRINIDGTKYVRSNNVILVKCKSAAEMKKLTREGFEFKGEKYDVLSASPSQEKHAAKYFFRVTEETPSQKTAFVKLEEINGYVFSKGLFPMKPSGRKFLKANARLGNYNSGMQKAFSIDLNKYRIAIVDNKSNGEGSIVGAYDYAPEVKAMMDRNGIEIDNHINDGAIYLGVPVVQGMGEFFGVKLSTIDALKSAWQVRISVITAKCMSRTLSETDLLTLAEGNNAKFYGNPNGELVLVTDVDGAKLINFEGLNNKDVTLDIYVMALAKQGNVKTSSQHLIKYLAVDADATCKFIKKQVKEQLENYYAGQLDETANATTTYGMMKSIMGEDALYSTMLNKSMIQDTIKYAEAMIARNKIAIDGVYTHMMFDASYALTKGAVSNILGVNRFGLVEAYSEDVNRIYAKEIAAIEKDRNLSEEDKEIQLMHLLSGIVVKFPSAMPNEYECIVYKTRKQMTDRINALKVTNEMKQTLMNYVDNTPFGTTVYAPINTLKNKLAGADVDFDATMCDMSELKHILIDKRIKEITGNLGKCAFISYKPIDRTVNKEDQKKIDEMEDME